eukprot:ANDGO_07063.mRNA.1 Suppressor of glycerol defect protein 1
MQRRGGNGGKDPLNPARLAGMSRKKVRQAVREEKKNRKREHFKGNHVQVKNSADRETLLRTNSKIKSEKYKTYDHHHVASADDCGGHDDADLEVVLEKPSKKMKRQPQPLLSSRVNGSETARYKDEDADDLDFDAIEADIEAKSNPAVRRMKRVDRQQEEWESTRMPSRAEREAAKFIDEEGEFDEIEYWRKKMGKAKKGWKADGLDYLTTILHMSDDENEDKHQMGNDLHGNHGVSKNTAKGGKRRAVQQTADDEESSFRDETEEGSEDSGDPSGEGSIHSDDEDERDEVDSDNEDAGDSVSESDKESEQDRSAKSANSKNPFVRTSILASQTAAAVSDAEMKQIRGVFNRMTPSNLTSYCFSALTSAFMTLGREKALKALEKIVLDPLAFNNRLLPRFIFTHACTIAFLARSQPSLYPVYAALLAKFEQLYGAESSRNEHRESLLNIASTVAAMYHLNVIRRSAIYDLLRRLLSACDELAVELVHRIAQYCGAKLKREDPTVFSQVLSEMQHVKASNAKRVQFILEAFEKAASQDSVFDIDEYVSVWKACMDYFEEHQIPELEVMADVPSVRGKPLASSKVSSSALPTDDRTALILEAANKDRTVQATDARKELFFTIQMADDVVDAADKLLKFCKKSKNGDRDVMRVVLHCMQKESKYNPFYSHLVRLLLRGDDKHRAFSFSLQYAIWDVFSGFQSSSSSRHHAVVNVGLFVAQLIMWDTLPFAVLRSLEFENLSPSSIVFLQTVLVSVLRQPPAKFWLLQEQHAKHAGLWPRHPGLRDGLLLFLTGHMIDRPPRSTVLADCRQLSMTDPVNDTILTERAKQLRRLLEHSIAAFPIESTRKRASVDDASDVDDVDLDTL